MRTSRSSRTSRCSGNEVRLFPFFYSYPFFPRASVCVRARRDADFVLFAPFSQRSRQKLDDE
jgi:hypothetical protein